MKPTDFTVKIIPDFIVFAEELRRVADQINPPNFCGCVHCACECKNCQKGRNGE